MGKINYSDIRNIKINNKNIYINLNRNIHIIIESQPNVQANEIKTV